MKATGGVLPAITKPVSIEGYIQTGALTNSASSGATTATLTIFLSENGGLSIDLGGDGPTRNDPVDSELAA